MNNAEKKAFLMVGLGTTYPEARRLISESADNKIRSDFPDYVVRQALHPQILVKKLAECDGIQVDDERQALERLQEEGFTEIIVQPFQIGAGEEYQRVKDVVQEYVGRKTFCEIVTLPCVMFGQNR